MIEINKLNNEINQIWSSVWVNIEENFMLIFFKDRKNIKWIFPLKSFRVFPEFFYFFSSANSSKSTFKRDVDTKKNKEIIDMKNHNILKHQLHHDGRMKIFFFLSN